jgi:hypothetical protein
MTNIKHKEASGMYDCDCGCCGPRAFPTKEEKIEMLKGYRGALEKEIKGIDEVMAKLRKEKTAKTGKSE